METGAIKKGDKVRVVRIEAEDELTREHMSCFLDWTGIVGTEPTWLPYEPEKGPLGRVVAKGECWVEFSHPCTRHGETGGVFQVNELDKVKEEE